MSLSDSALNALAAAAATWADEDPDPQTSGELRGLLARLNDDGQAGAAAGQELADSFGTTVQFGTAGLRAPLGAGPNRMNRVVVRRTAAGVAAYLLEAAGAGTGGSGGSGMGAAYRPRAVVGYDARHNSDIFAQETAAVFTAAGLETFLLPTALPTPLLAYAVRALDCDAGIMVTASHNPPQDNGYKVYLGGRTVTDSGQGAQIVAPLDAGIAAKIDYTTPLADIGLAAGGWTVLDESLVADYAAAVTALVDPERFPARALKIVLTPMHGVGGGTMLRVFRQAGFAEVTLVAEQAVPDPDFPTVAFPNPEEAGAMDLALATAEAHGADLVIANDPDADRCAVAAREPDTGAWRMLRGDEVGALLGAHLAARLGDGARAEAPVFASSIVSSRLLAKVAAAAGFEHVQTLTGFKWISRVPGLSYSYEEALGYCVAPGLVRDKDGISAALLVAELAAALKADGRTLFDALDELALIHGLHVSDQLSVRVGNLGLLDAMMNRLRANAPTSFAGSPVDTMVDLSEGSPGLPPTDGLLFVTRNDTRVIIRPSGTEPKLKCYLEVIAPVGAAAELAQVRADARAALDAVRGDIEEALGL